AVTADLSALVQPIGYIIAALGPIGFGLLLQSLGNQTIPLIAMSVTGLLMGVATFVGAGTGMIDDELEA
ncbi:MAG: MFS transporter, partial [Trueperella pyogenes]|nr:MFS transporter [Trueperella pyogenes]